MSGAASRSGVGSDLPDIAEGWSVTTVREIVTTLRYGTSTKADADVQDGVPILRMSNIQDGTVDLSELKYVPRSHDLDNLTLAPGDILFNRTNSPELVGKAAVVDAAREMVFASYLIRLRCRDDIADPKFLCGWINSPWGKHWAARERTDGVSQSNLNGTKLAAMELPLAPLVEQRRIVKRVENLLAEVNRVRTRLDRVAQLLKRFRQSLLHQAFSGALTEEWRAAHPNTRPPVVPSPSEPARKGRRGANLSGKDTLLVDDEMSEIPATWDWTRIDRLVEPETVITYGIVLPGPEIVGGVPYVRQQDIDDGWIRTPDLRHTTQDIADKHTRSSLKEGDLLLCIIRNLRVAVVPAGLDGANITQGAVRIRPNGAVVHRDYLLRYLQSPTAQRWMQQRYFGMDMPRINVEDARAIPVPLPSLEEQIAISAILGEAMKLADSVERGVQVAAARAEKLPQAILAKAFSGELVPTEAELARAEGRTYESAEDLLRRIAAAKPPTPPKPSTNARARKP